ncbi:MAG: polysaccharide lyase family 8 super-sandwich domain-containing protein, partial [Bacteroidota bacterium]
AEWAAYVADTPFAFRDSALATLVDYYLDGIVKQHIFGKYPDTGVLNRSNSRPRTFIPAGTKIARNLLAATNYRAEELRQVIALRETSAKPTASFARFYWQTEHFVFQRPDWYASVRMHSVRNANMEVPYNEEGFKNHHRGDGANHLHLRGDEYLNVWPVYDYQKIPGTTVLQKDTLYPEEVQRYGTTTFAGAVTDGHYGAVGYDFISPHDGTKARKAWFFFDDEYLCLGAGIESRDRHQSVITTLDQRLRRGPITVTNKAGTRVLAAETSFDEPTTWIHHDGTGYHFLGAEPRIQLAAISRTGRWTDINHQWDSPREPVTKDIFQLWLDHGPRPHGRPGGLNHADMRPQDVKYAYEVVPNVEAEEMTTRKPSVRVLANNRWLQAVTHAGLGLTQVIAYRGGSVELDGRTKLTLDGPGALLLQRNQDGSLRKITVADPGRRLDRLHFSVSGHYDGAGEGYTARYETTEDRTYFSVELPKGEFAGSSVVLQLPN